MLKYYINIHAIQWMVAGVTGVSVVKHVVGDRGKGVVQNQSLVMEEPIAQKNMDVGRTKSATLKNAPVSKNNTIIHSTLSLDEQNNLNNSNNSKC